MKMKSGSVSASIDSPNKMRRASQKRAADDYATVGEKLLPLRTEADILNLCRTVELSRTTVSHDLNERSSRSHCLVTVHMYEKSGGTSVELIRTSRRPHSFPRSRACAGAVRHNTCLLVDLAGSERIAKTNVQGNAKAQAIEINKSLTALGRVVKALGARGKS